MFPTPLEAPAYVLWEITLGCNQRCSHCASSAGRRRPDELTTVEALDVCDQLADLGVPGVTLMGGEPLVRRDWGWLARRLRERGVQVALVSNGWLFDDAVARQVAELDLCQLGFSLDAADPAVHDARRGRHGAHTRAVAAIRRALELPLAHRTVITSVSRSTLAELPALGEWLAANTPGVTWQVNVASCHDRKRLGGDELLREEDFLELARFIHARRRELAGRLTVTATHDLGYYSREFPDLYAFDWRGCAAGLETLGIRSHGDVVGCLVMDESFVEGNVRERSLASLWADPHAFAYNRRFRPELLEGACAGCDLGAACRGGCRERAVAFTGSRFEYPFCLHRLESARGEAGGGQGQRSCRWSWTLAR